MVPNVDSFAERLLALARSEDRAAARGELDGTLPEDYALAIQRLDPDEAKEVFAFLEPEEAAYVLIELPTADARSIVKDLPDETVAHYLDILPMDDALDLREELGEERFETLLQVIPAEDAREIYRLLSYPEGSVGRLMTERFFEVAPQTTMAELIEDIRRASLEKYETVNDVYVLTPERFLVGVFGLRKAIRAGPEVTAAELMREDVITIAATDPAEDAARKMARYGFYALPILDGRGRMVGLFTGDDAQTILREAETVDIERLGAVTGPTDAYLSLGVRQLAWKRLPWLMALFVAETLTGSVMRHYGGEGEINPVMFFLPLLIGAGGNSGSQTTTMITRALAIGEVQTRDWWEVLRKEFLTACIVGSALGLAGFSRALVWGTDPQLSYAVGLALPAIVIWSTAVGSLLPLAARAMKIDPAVMSAPFITTFVDATGLVIYFEMVKAFFGGRLGV